MAELKADNKIKVIAYYLPQYHSIPENDAAWGKGFTEWVNTKKAKPQFEGHYQPKTPLNDNYYDLSDVNVMVKQAAMAKKYGIYGFCYYHYWFKNGKKLLEKPVEQMLKTSKVDIPFCMSWANENWSKRWDGGKEELIVEQDYGEEEDWRKHLEYLSAFFRDPRYITLDGKPVFLIYKPAIIPKIDKMLKYWQSLAKELGFKGFCFMIQSSDYYFSPFYDMEGFDYQIKFPPFFATVYAEKNMDFLWKEQSLFKSLKYLHLKKAEMWIYKRLKDIRDKKKREQKRNIQTRLQYDQTWQTLIESDSRKFMIEGAFVDWDNTARKVNGHMHLGACPEKFEKYMRLVIRKIRNNSQENIIFINAWNEWAEGAYLEPDTLHGYGYLEALSRVIQENDNVL